MINISTLVAREWALSLVDPWAAGGPVRVTKPQWPETRRDSLSGPAASSGCPGPGPGPRPPARAVTRCDPDSESGLLWILMMPGTKTRNLNPGGTCQPECGFAPGGPSAAASTSGPLNAQLRMLRPASD